MKVSASEKKLLTVLLIALLSFLSYSYIYIPSEEAIAKLTEEKETVQGELNEATQKLARKKEIDDNYAAIEMDLKTYSDSFYSNKAQEDFIKKLYEFGFESNVDILSINFPKNGDTANETDLKLKDIKLQIDIAEAEFNANTGENGEINIEASPAIATDHGKMSDTEIVQYEAFLNTIKVTSANVSFEGTYSECYTLLELIQSNDKYVTVNSFNITPMQTYRQPTSDGSGAPAGNPAGAPANNPAASPTRAPANNPAGSPANNPAGSSATQANMNNSETDPLNVISGISKESQRLYKGNIVITFYMVSDIEEYLPS